MGKIVKHNLPCIDQVGCGSSDALQLYEDGSSFCFSCMKPFKSTEGQDLLMEVKSKSPSLKLKISVEEIQTFACRGFKERNIEKSVSEFFGVKASYDSNGEIDTHYYPYSEGKGYKVRKLPKDFSWAGEANGLFGMEKFASGGKRLVITEGELDAMSVAQASLDRYQKIYPVVSLSSASATNALLQNRDWIRSFSEVILFLDNDKAGQEATEKAIKIIGLDKIKIVKQPETCKDASDILVKLGAEMLMRAVWDAHAYIPPGIATKEDLWDALVSYNAMPSHPYPDCVGGLNKKLKGKRKQEIALFISGTGSGKSTIMREIALDVLLTTEDKIGIVSLEESKAETARLFSGMALSRNPAFQEIPLNELKVGFDKVFGDDRVVVLDHDGNVTDDSIIDKIEYMALSGCGYIIVDHVTILTSEGADGLKGNEAIDKIMNGLGRVVKRHPVWIGLVSHLRKAQSNSKPFEEGRMPSIDDIRGSGSIKQVSFDIVAFTRNLTAESDRERNSIQMRVLKSRYTGLTGDVPGAVYNYETGRLSLGNDLVTEEFERIEVT